MARLIGSRFVIGCVFAAVASGHGPAFSQEAPAPIAPGDTVRVERTEPQEKKPESLRFLRENREFLRAEIDALRLRSRSRDGGALLVDPRILMLRSMLDAIHAARDTTAGSAEWVERDRILREIGELAEIEARLAALEGELALQGERLERLDADFAARQRTSLVVFVTGRPAGSAPAGILVRDPAGETLRTALTPEQCGALAEGGLAEVYNEDAEPRRHELEIALIGGGWDGSEPLRVGVDPERGRITFLTVDLTGADPARGAAAAATATWVK